MRQVANLQSVHYKDDAYLVDTRIRPVDKYVCVEQSSRHEERGRQKAHPSMCLQAECQLTEPAASQVDFLRTLTVQDKH